MATFDKLTHQEQRILSMVAQGFRNAKIATELVISTRTVETHLYHIFDKLGVSTRTQAAIYALQTDVIQNTEISRASRESNNQLNYS